MIKGESPRPMGNKLECDENSSQVAVNTFHYRVSVRWIVSALDVLQSLSGTTGHTTAYTNTCRLLVGCHVYTFMSSLNLRAEWQAG